MENYKNIIKIIKGVVEVNNYYKQPWYNNKKVESYFKKKKKEYLDERKEDNTKK